MNRVKDKLAIITGAARGFGKADALTLAREGADIAIWEINMDGAVQTAKEVRALGRKALAMKVDITNSSEINEVAQKVLDEFGKIDILVNNAGITPLGPFAPILIAISPADILEIIMGIKNGLTLPGPFSNNILCCFSNVPIPPIPEPIITPVE